MIKDVDPVSTSLFFEVLRDLGVVLGFDDVVVLEFFSRHRSRSLSPLESGSIEGGKFFTTAKVFNDCWLLLLGEVPPVAFRTSEDLVGGLAVIGREDGVEEGGAGELMGSGGDHFEESDAGEAEAGGRVLSLSW